jgi:magnesium chelatase family protein
MIQRYLGRISGPLLDRIDLHVEVPAVPYRELRGKDEGVSSAEIRARVERVRAVQQARGFYNSRIPVRVLRKLCALDDAGERTLEMAVRRGIVRPRARPDSQGRKNHRGPRRSRANQRKASCGGGPVPKS